MRSPRARAAGGGLLLVFPLLAGPARATSEELGAFVERGLARAEVRGATVALVHAGEPYWIRSFGVRDERSGAPVSDRTIFQAASLGKVVAAYGALLLVERGVLALDEPAVAEGLDVAPGCRAPTLRQLLSHTAGLGNAILATRWQGACDPPAPFAYAGEGWRVLQAMLADRTGVPAEVFLRKAVFAPLGMDRSSFSPPDDEDVAVGHVDALFGVGANKADAPVVATGMLALVVAVGVAWAAARGLWRRNRGVRAWASIALAWLGIALVLLAGGAAWTVPVRPGSERVLLPSSFHTSGEDLVRFVAELSEPTLVRRETRDLLFAPQVEVGAGIAWGVGLGLDASVEPRTGWQWGSNPGFQSLMVLEPTRGDAVVVLTNTGGFADLLSLRRGGYNAAKRIARRALGIHGRWDLRPGTRP